MTATVRLWEHFTKLTDFSGREDRASFWPYAALVFGLSMIGGFAVMIPVMATTMSKMQQYAAAHPDQVTVTSGPGHYSMTVHGNPPEVMPDFTMFIGGIGIVVLVTALLYAAAVVRRLRDTGRSGWWGLLPVPFLLYSFVQMPRLFGSAASGAPPDIGLFFSIFVSNLLYLIALVALIVLLAGRSDPQQNRYGTDI